MGADGSWAYPARSHDLIDAAGDNIARLEVEAALLPHAAVTERGVVGARAAAQNTGRKTVHERVHDMVQNNAGGAA